MSAVRPARRGDEAAMKRVWQTCFGDEAAYIDGFFAALYRAENALVTEEGGAVCGMAQLLFLGDLVSADGETRRPCAVTYALAVLPEARGRGFGEELARAAFDLARLRGAVPLIVPASGSLFDYYAARTDYVSAFTAAERSFPACAGQTEPIDAADYLRRREELLAGRAHIAINADAMAYQASLCRRSGGGLYAAAGAVAAVEGAFIKELLAPAGGEAAAAGAVAVKLGLAEIRARFPAAEGPFAMAARGAVSGAAWFGFAFD